jgi:Zn-dependent protease/predicted transcriptional regulator
MRTTIPLGRWAGIPVGLNWTVLLTIAFIAQAMALSALPAAVPRQPTAAYWGAGVAVGVVFLAALLAHELAHAVIARRHGVRVERITLWLLGGTTVISDQAPSAKTELRIAAAGPLTSLAAGGVFILLGLAAGQFGSPELVIASLGWLGGANILLAAFNLLPAAPLDGGRLLHAVLWRRSGDRRRATAAVAVAGRGLGMMLVALGMVQLLFGGLLAGMWLGLVGWYLTTAASAEQTGSLLREQLAGVTVRDVMDEPLVAPSWLTVEAFLDRVASYAGRRAFPVVDFTNHPCGVLTLRDLVRLTPQQRLNTRVADVCRPLAQIPVAAPDDLLLDVLAGRRARSDLILVVDHDQLVGVVTSTDIARVMELAALRRTPPHRPSDE